LICDFEESAEYPPGGMKNNGIISEINEYCSCEG
jgi:hypothetical protein